LRENAIHVAICGAYSALWPGSLMHVPGGSGTLLVTFVSSEYMRMPGFFPLFALRHNRVGDDTLRQGEKITTVVRLIFRQLPMVFVVLPKEGDNNICL
jgi:hypothetical protein